MRSHLAVLLRSAREPKDFRRGLVGLSAHAQTPEVGRRARRSGRPGAARSRIAPVCRGLPPQGIDGRASDVRGRRQTAKAVGHRGSEKNSAPSRRPSGRPARGREVVVLLAGRLGDQQAAVAGGPVEEPVLVRIRRRAGRRRGRSSRAGPCSSAVRDGGRCWRPPRPGRPASPRRPGCRCRAGCRSRRPA